MRIPYAFSRRAHSIQMVIIAGSTRAVCWSLPTETNASANNGHRRMVMLELSRRAIIGIDYPSDGIAAACGRIARKSNVYRSYRGCTLDLQRARDWREIFRRFARVTRTVEGALRRRLADGYIVGPPRHTRAYRVCIICMRMPPANTSAMSKQSQRINSKRTFIFFLFRLLNLVVEKDNARIRYENAKSFILCGASLHLQDYHKLE